MWKKPREHSKISTVGSNKAVMLFTPKFHQEHRLTPDIYGKLNLRYNSCTASKDESYINRKVGLKI